MDEIDYETLVEEALKSGIERFVVASVIFEDNRFLLLKRPVDEFMGGIYELPSGKVETNEPLKSALIRETKEETGLDVTQVSKYLGFFDYISGSGKKTRQFNFLVRVIDFKKIILTEHECFVWSARNDLSKWQVTDSVKRILFSV